MINLLPLAEKEKILIDAKIKVVAVIWFLIIFFIFCLVGFLIFINFYIKIQLDGQRIQISETNVASSNAKALDLENKITLFDSDLNDISTFFQNRIYFSEIFNKISGVLPANVYLTNLTAIKGKVGVKVSVSGFSPNRDDLLELKKNIDKDSIYFNNVYFPQSDWVRPSDIDFFISFGQADEVNKK
jgi:Tfp pilus assembly protein PilN